MPFLSTSPANGDMISRGVLITYLPGCLPKEGQSGQDLGCAFSGCPTLANISIFPYPGGDIPLTALNACELLLTRLQQPGEITFHAAVSKQLKLAI